MNYYICKATHKECPRCQHKEPHPWNGACNEDSCGKRLYDVVISAKCIVCVEETKLPDNLFVIE